MYIIDEYITFLKEFLYKNIDDVMSCRSIEPSESARAELIDILELTCKSISIDNYMEHGDPVLSINQLDTCIHLACTEFHLNELVSKGLVESKLDLDTGQFVYQITESGRSLIS
jgi:hypothetical protein